MQFERKMPLIQTFNTPFYSATVAAVWRMNVNKAARSTPTQRQPL
jgi:hypothetical protein